MASIVLRPLLKKPSRKRVVLFGHKYNGNLKTFAEYCLKRGEVDVCFVTIDPEYYQEVKGKLDVPVLYLQKFSDVLKVASASAVVSDRKAHALIYYMLFTSMPFLDVWHGIQLFKRFSADNMAMLKRYREIWTSSPAVAALYTQEYGIPKQKVFVTGYGRVDPLVNGDYDPKRLKKKYDISSSFDKIILLAPTWQQGDPTRQVIPFNEKPEHFLSSLNKIAESTNSLIIFRAHLNTDNANRSNIHEMQNIKVMSHNDYPLSEEFLAFTDVFIGDWSSIAFDYLPLHRPAIFLKVPIPFRHGLSFGDENQYGARVSSLDELTDTLRRYLVEPERYLLEHGDQVRRTELLAYGDTLDGQANVRYYERLMKVLG